MKSDFRSENFKRKFSRILFNRERPLNKGIKKPELKVYPGLGLIGL